MNGNPYYQDAAGNYYSLTGQAKPNTNVDKPGNSALHNYLMGQLLKPQTSPAVTPNGQQINGLAAGAGPLNAPTAAAMDPLTSYAIAGLNPPAPTANKSSY